MNKLTFFGWTPVAAPTDGPFDAMFVDAPLDGILEAPFVLPFDETFAIVFVPPLVAKFEGITGDAWATCHNRDATALVDIFGTTAPAAAKLGDV